MRVCGAVRVGLFTMLVAAAWLGEQGRGAVAQTRQSISRTEPANVYPRKESAPRKEAGIPGNEYTAGLVTGAPHSTEFAIAQEIATTLASGQETGPVPAQTPPLASVASAWTGPGERPLRAVKTFQPFPSHDATPL